MKIGMTTYKRHEYRAIIAIALRERKPLHQAALLFESRKQIKQQIRTAIATILKQ